MLVCKEQQNPIMFMGRAIQISDKVANAHYHLCSLPVDEGSVRVYLQFYLKENYQEKCENLSEDEIAHFVEEGVKREFFDLCDTNEWNGVVE